MDEHPVGGLPGVFGCLLLFLKHIAENLFHGRGQTRAGLLVGRARMSPRRSSGASHEGGQTGSLVQKAYPRASRTIIEYRSWSGRFLIAAPNGRRWPLGGPKMPPRCSFGASHKGGQTARWTQKCGAGIAGSAQGFLLAVVMPLLSSRTSTPTWARASSWPWPSPSPRTPA